ncbi:hypothetical protein Bca4012_068778 [Brassica carinata]
MGETIVCFNVWYGGKFETGDDPSVVYIRGREMVLESEPHALFRSLRNALTVPFSRQRFWYKLPAEDLSDLKILCDSSPSFEKMCEVANSTGCIDIYMEKDEDSDEIGDDTGHENGEEAADNLRDGSNEVCAEESRVENIIADIVDDDDEVDGDMVRTPPPSDGEEDEENPIYYERWKRGSGELAIRQVFVSVEEFKEAVLEYALMGGWNIKMTKSGAIKCEARCAVVSEEPCLWRIYCSFEKSVNQWMVKTFQEEHTCTKDGRCRLMSEGVIAKLIVNEIRNQPAMKPKAIQAKIEERYNLLATDDQCRKARKKALDIIRAEYDEQFARIKDYKLEILESNDGSTVDVRTAIREDGLEVFDRFYVCFAALRKTWKAHCRPIFGIDGCFLKSDTKGQLLAAVGRDANNQIYPIAWACVQVEDTESWLWFIQKLKGDLDLCDGDGFTLISDRQKGLLIAVEKELPKIEHRMCARHIYGNLRRYHSKKPQMKTLFWEIVHSFNEADYKVGMKKLKAYDVEVYEAFKQRNPSSCSRAFFGTRSSCEDALNNFSESYNNTIEKARALPLVEMLETMRRQTMVRISLRKQKTGKWNKRHSLKVDKVIAAEEKERKNCSVAIPSTNGTYEVIENGIAHKVHMRLRTCTCRRWDLTGIPCRHALKVVLLKKLNVEDYISDWYLTSKWVAQYSDTISAMNGLKFWKKSGESTLTAPPREPSKGRNKNPEKRKKGINEEPKKGKKVTNHGRKMQCYRCGLFEHNSRKCINGGVPYKPRKPKKAKTKTTSGMDSGEGPSQQNQPS